jgi:prepilin-type processing-associated H-X9-DG protein
MRNWSNGNAAKDADSRMPAGLTLAELIVAIGVVALLLILSIPLLNRARSNSFRQTCANNLVGIGRTMLIYDGDCSDDYPHAGGGTSAWGRVAWDAPTRRAAYGLDANGAGGNASVSSSLYLLVKYEQTMKSFICRADRGTREWLGEPNKGTPPKFWDYWDFGPDPQIHCSYSYHWPFGPKPLSGSSEPNFVVASDRSPWIPSPGRKAKPYPKSPGGQHVYQGKSGASADRLYGNTDIHQEDGQNVLFMDGHVIFNKRPYAGLDDDNIYTRSAIPDKGDPLGVLPGFSTPGPPANRRDSVLVHDPPVWPAGGGR